MAGIYVHIPFCRRKCLYCDFYSVGERLADWRGYVSAVLHEAGQRLGPPAESGITFDTLYFGGGTPSLMPTAEFLRLSQGLSRYAPHLREFTVEVNPDDVTPQTASAWAEAGVDRISMGVQSLNDTELKFIGRRHDACAAREAFKVLRNHFGNISLDLMFGLPGQTLESLCQTVRGFIAMRPEHISAYSLMYEERTALTRMLSEGKIRETDEADSARMFLTLSEMLDKAGYEQYEISNYALPDFRSRHNSSYWQGVAYVGLGPGAHSYDGDRIRSHNRPDVKRYMSLAFDELRESETLTDDELREEMIMTRLRTREGLDLDLFAARFGNDKKESLLRKAERWIRSGQLENADLPANAGRLALTRSGIMISDEIFSDLF